MPPEVEILAIAGSGTEGLQEIRTHQPDLIFLDVEMADMTGFEMLAALVDIHFQIIFITSYSHYAIKAIRLNALDYLVKPIDLEELKQAIQRYKSNAQNNKGTDNVRQALINLKTKNKSEQTLILKAQDGELRLVLKNIIRIKGDRNYSYIFLADHKNKLTSKPLGELEELLHDNDFFRCHKSHLVNYLHICSLPNSAKIILSDNSVIPIARRKKEAFKLWYDSYLNILPL